METLEIGFLEALRQGKGYDFLAQQGHLFSKEQLKRIAMECIYEMHFEDEMAHNINVADELEEFWS